MNWRWWLWLVGVGLIALLALFPLRVALDATDVARVGLTTRQVAGTIWYGRLGDLHLGDRPLGTFEVALNPGALLLGRASMTFERLDGIDGPLGGRLVVGSRRGVVDVDGRVAVGDIFSPLPIEALEFKDFTVLFRDGVCVEAAGQVTPVVAIPVLGIQFGSGLSGVMECDGQRARVTMASGSGRERIEFYVRSTGAYRGWMSVRDAPPDAAIALSLFGFRPSPQGLTLSVDGQL